MWFLAVFYAVWPIQIVAFVVPTVPNNYWIYLLAAIFGPLQGFMHALIVFCRDKKSIQRRASEHTKKLMSRVSIKFRNIGPNEVVSAELAGDFETIQPVECSFNREEAAQLEIGVVQVGRFGEEEKTPEVALNSEGGGGAG